MKHWFLRLFIMLGITLAGTGQASADGASSHGITITGAWAKASLIGAPTGAAYLVVANKGKEGDVIIAITTPVAEAAELHTMEMAGNIMKMRSIESIGIPAGGMVTLEPSKIHIMLIGLKKQLKAGETFPLVITFKQAGQQHVDVIIK